MPDKKISELAVAAALGGTELVEAVQAGANVKATITQIGTRIQAQLGFTAFGLSLINDADAAAGRTTLGAVSLAGDTMTGALQVPAGTVGAPGLAFGEANSGIYRPGAGILAATTGGVEAIRVDSAQRILKGHTAAVPNSVGTFTIQNHVSGASNGIAAFQWSSVSGAGPYFQLCRSKSDTKGTFTDVGNNDDLGAIGFEGALTGDFVQAARMLAEVDGVPAAGVVPGRISWATTPLGGTLTERLRITSTGDLQMGGTNIVISSSRHHRLRAYTLGTLPATGIATGDAIWCSDLAGGAGQLNLVSGTAWSRATPGGPGTNTTSTGAVTLTPLIDPELVRFTAAALSGNVTVTLSTTGAVASNTRFFVRAPDAFDGFSFRCNSIYMRPAETILFAYDGSAYVTMARMPSGNWELFKSLTATGASVSVANLDGQREVKIVGAGVSHNDAGSQGIRCRLAIDGGAGAWLATGYVRVGLAAAATDIFFTAATTGATLLAWEAELSDFYSTRQLRCQSMGGGEDATGGATPFGITKRIAALYNALMVYPSGGSFDGGTVNIYVR